MSPSPVFRDKKLYSTGKKHGGRSWRECVWKRVMDRKRERLIECDRVWRENERETFCLDPVKEALLLPEFYHPTVASVGNLVSPSLTTVWRRSTGYPSQPRTKIDTRTLSSEAHFSGIHRQNRFGRFSI